MEHENFEQVKGDLFDSLLQRSFEIEAVEEEKSHICFEPPLGGEGEAHLLFDEDDRDILMHRDAHFASSFPIMIEQYENETPAAVLDVDVDRIRELEMLEKRLGRNIAPIVLQGADVEKIAKVRSLYRTLREQCEQETTPLMKLCAELILAEEEYDIEKFKAFGSTAERALLQIIQTDELYDPLFPGYGRACQAACRALALVGSKEAIPILFSLIGRVDFEIENEVISALAAIGDEAKKFCIKMLKAKPLGVDNERASIALCSFAMDDEIAQAVKELRVQPDVKEKKILVRYLENLYQDI
jgi:hypothetical protein